MNQTEVVEKKLMEVQEQHDNVLLKNRELIDRVCIFPFTKLLLNLLCITPKIGDFFLHQNS